MCVCGRTHTNITHMRTHIHTYAHTYIRTHISIHTHAHTYARPYFVCFSCFVYFTYFSYFPLRDPARGRAWGKDARRHHVAAVGAAQRLTKGKRGWSAGRRCGRRPARGRGGRFICIPDTHHSRGSRDFCRPTRHIRSRTRPARVFVAFAPLRSRSVREGIRSRAKSGHAMRTMPQVHAGGHADHRC
jgi:hypothetical protein